MDELMHATYKVFYEMPETISNIIFSFIYCIFTSVYLMDCAYTFPVIQNRLQHYTATR